MFNESCDEEKSRLQTEVGRLNRLIDTFIDSITCKNHSLCSMAESVYEEIYEKKARHHFKRPSFESVRGLPPKKKEKPFRFPKEKKHKPHPMEDVTVGDEEDMKDAFFEED